MENEWPGSPCLIRFGNRQECGYGKYNADGKYVPGEKNIRSFRRNFGMVALAVVAALSCVGADVVCAQTSSGDVRVASGQSVASGQDLESAGVRPGWRLVWEENFESERMDWSVWSKTVRGTADWADTQSADERCYGFRNGNLILRGIINDDLEADTARYLTGGVVTQGKKAFAFPGRIEVRARLQAATGAWPAIWLLPSDPAVRWPQGGEIDIMERLNYDGFVYQTVHSSYTYVLGHRDEPANYSTMEIDPEGFNTYGVDVFRDSVVLYVNGVRNFSYPRVPDAADTLGQFPFFQPMYLLIDMQLGGSWVGETDPEDLPVEMEVDWVRYYVPEDGRPDSPEIRPAVSIVPRPAVMRLSEGAPLRISSRRLSVSASDSQIKVIPEIEMPGHALAALAAYPWLGCTGGPYEVRTTWGISDDVFCIGKESTFGFLTDVLDEVCRLFPGEYVHVGGDEAPAVRWETCPDCQALMRREQLADERQLQGYLLHRIEEFLNARGKKLIGWDEILEGGVTPGATVMSWRGPEGGIRAAGQGNDVVMVPKRYFYFDYYQTAYPSANGEPLGIGGYVPLERCYSFDPFDGLDGEARTHIKGIQANTWTEYIPCFDHVQHMDLPRLSALSEVAWGRYGADYGDFTHRLASSMKAMYEYYGWIYAPYVFDGVK